MTAANHLRLIDPEGSTKSAPLGSEPVRVPPHDLDAEAAVLATVLIDDKRIGSVRSVLRPEHCYSESHRRILEAAYALNDAGQPVDVVTVGAWLKSAGRLSQVGGMAYLTEILNAAPAVANVRAYVAIVFERWRVREIVMASERIAAQGYIGRPNDAQAYADESVRALAHIARQQIGRRRETNAEALTRIFEELQRRANGSDAVRITGIPTGFREIDERTGGLHAGHKITIVALPGLGKTTSALQIARHVASQGIGVLYISAEQTHDECLLKTLSSCIGVSFMAIKKGDLTPKGWADLTEASVALSKLPLWFEAGRDMTVDDVRATAMRQAEDTANGSAPLGLVIVDHLHRLAPLPSMQNAKRNEQVDANTKALKKLAQELGMPVLELAQQKTLVDKSPKARPGDNCVAWSMDVQREADDLIYLHGTGPAVGGRRPVTAIVHKARFGEPGDVPLLLNGECSRFEEIT